MLEQLLLNQIELLRQRLNIAAEKRDFNFLHPEVIKISSDLDKLLVRYKTLRTSP